MPLTQRKSEPSGTVVAGTILLRENDLYVVGLEGRSRRQVKARRAASCLLAPEPPDRVLVTLVPEPFVLAVLERTAGRPARLVVDGDATLAASGKLELRGETGASLVTPGEASIAARALEVHAQEARVGIGRLTALAASVLGQFAELRVVSKCADFFADQLTSRLGRSFRHVGGEDAVRAGTIEYRAEGQAALKGQNTAVVARQIARIDGEQISIG
ncbi:MAG: DUF3540 domain-containing protein [Myxococcales bacterium]|nr:DUF3540 domain-containing protein [Myxococcales bacterium]